MKKIDIIFTPNFLVFSLMKSIHKLHIKTKYDKKTWLYYYYLF